jgi:hypothetical protein
MRCERIFLAATALAALGLAGCHSLRTPTEPPPLEGLTGPYSFSLSTTIRNSAGAATLVNGQILIDNFVVAESCPQEDLFPQLDPDGNVIGFLCYAPATSRATLSVNGHIGPGSHTILFFISDQILDHAPYTVMAFTFQVKDGQGNPIKSISLPTQSGDLASGQSIVYQITI